MADNRQAYFQSNRERSRIPSLNGVRPEVVYAPNIVCDSISAKSITTQAPRAGDPVSVPTVFHGNVTIDEGKLVVNRYLPEDYPARNNRNVAELFHANTQNPPTYAKLKIGTNNGMGNHGFLQWVYQGDNAANSQIQLGIWDHGPVLECYRYLVFGRETWTKFRGYMSNQCIDQQAPGTANTWWRVGSFERNASNTGPMHFEFLSEGERLNGTTNSGMIDVCHLFINCSTSGYLDPASLQTNIAFWKETAGPYNGGQTRDLQVVVYIDTVEPRYRVYIKKVTGVPLKTTCFLYATDVNISGQTPTAIFDIPGVNCGDLAVPNDLTAGTLAFDSDQPNVYPYWTRPVVGKMSCVIAPTAPNDVVRLAEFAPAVLGGAANIWTDSGVTLTTDAQEFFTHKLANTVTLSSPNVWTGTATGAASVVTYVSAVTGSLIPANDVIAPIYISIVGTPTLATLRIAAISGTISITSSVPWAGGQLVIIGPISIQWHV